MSEVIVETKRNKLRDFVDSNGDRALTIAFYVGAAIGLHLVFADSRMDIMGDNVQKVPQEELNAQAIVEAEQLYADAPDAGRYAMLYLNDSDPILVKDIKGGNGFFGSAGEFNDYPTEVYTGQDCLAGSAFDSRPSEIRGRTSGDIGATASVTIEDDLITVRPAATDAEPLRFAENSAGLLEADNSFTRNTLVAYGCDPEPRL